MILRALIAGFSFFAGCMFTKVSIENKDPIIRAGVILRKIIIPPVYEEGAPKKFLMVEETKVFLDGKETKYENVPNDATVDKIDLAKDGITILRIEFKSPKK